MRRGVFRRQHTLFPSIACGLVVTVAPYICGGLCRGTAFVIVCGQGRVASHLGTVAMTYNT